VSLRHLFINTPELAFDRGVFKDLESGLPAAGLIPADGNILLPPESYPSLEALRGRSGAKA
jgi:hypothetical protein